jgi:hypothetical protein
MLVYKNFLSENVILALKEDAGKRAMASLFKPNNNHWPENLIVNLPGVVSISNVSDNIRNILTDRIIKATKAHVPCSKEIACMHYFWHPLSGINMHTDKNKDFGATIYLNNDWDIHYGGLLLELDRQSQQIIVQVPEYNKCVINVTEQNHMVTPTAFHAPIRHTIQIFGVKNET